MADNRRALFIAGFLTLIAAGIGFGVRTGLLKVWSEQYGFTMTQLGGITGGGLLGFGCFILLSGLFLDALGYRVLLLLAFVLHIASAVMTFSATSVFNSAGQAACYNVLFWAMFVFAIANGICEAVINPLTAALYPKEKTHYLNILHAGWPGGLVIGGLICFLIGSVRWELLLATYLIPSVVYGAITLFNKFPQTDAQAGDISYGGMMRDCLVPLFFVLLLVHAMVGYVELGTDSWINKITGSILQDPNKGTMLFIYTSMLMFVLRFFAGPIVHRISSLGLLFASACLGAIGLFLLGSVEGALMMVVAATIYACGKTFLWPTMLGVVGERFPRSATIAMAMLGAAGMLSAGGLGGPGIGYKQDYFASQKLQDESEATFDRYQADQPNAFLMFPEITGLNGSKVKVLTDRGQELEQDIALLGERLQGEDYQSTRTLQQWWQENKQFAEDDAQPVNEAVLHGSRQALRYTALIPVTMAVFYLVLLVTVGKPTAAETQQ